MARFGLLAPLMDVKPYRNAHLLRRALDVHRGQRILDVGGGTGIVEQRTGLHGAVVLDAQPAMLARTRDKDPDLVPVLGDAGQLPFADGSFDRVMIVDSLHHFADPGRALVEAARVLADDGRMVVEEILPRSAFGRFVRFVEAVGRFGSTFLEPRDLKEMIERVGMDCKVEKWSPRSYAAVAVHDHTPKERPGALA